MNPGRAGNMVVALCAAFGQHGCDERGAAARAESACDARIRELDNRLGARIDGAEKALASVKWDALMLKWKTEEHDAAVFTPGSAGYSRVDTHSGTFLVSV